ncbi:MAG: hypothetical protein ACTHKZ_02395 [Lysobacteraceae bacterium]
MHTIAPRLLTLALGAALALPAFAQSTSGQETQGTQSTQGQQDTSAQDTGSNASSMSQQGQTDANGWQSGQASSANTQAGAGMSADSFGTLDTDHDGRISSAEAGASANFMGRFKSLDRNGDGYVSQKEFHKGLRDQSTPTSTP